MAKGQAHSEELKAKVRAAYLLNGKASVVAKEFGLDRTVVWRMIKEIPGAVLQHTATENSNRIEVAITGYLEANLKAMTAQAVMAGDPEYVKRFPPQQLAVLHKELGATAIRLFEAGSGAAAGGAAAEDQEIGHGQQVQPPGGKIVVEYFDDTTSTAAHWTEEDQG